MEQRAAGFGSAAFILAATQKKEGTGMAEIIKMKKGDTLILQSEYCMRKEDIAKEKQWFKDAMGINVVIVNGQYEIKGVEENGERVR